MPIERSICIAGAGNIGCFVGGLLAAAGHRVRFLARRRTIDAVWSDGLQLSDLEGLELTIPADRLTLSDDPAIMTDADTILVTVKSSDTPEIAGLIAAHGAEDAIIVSLQNGVRNTSVLRERLPGRRVLGGMVPFNVLAPEPGRFHRATSGEVAIEQDPSGVAERLSVPHLKMKSAQDIAGLQWGKLLINLNNALNALSGLPLSQQLAQRPWRLLLAAQMEEGLAAMKADGLRPVSSTPIPPALAAWLLRLPDGLFRIALGRSMTIDPKARSSMWEDLQHRRPTEIDYLQGEIIRLATRHGLSVPLSRRIVDLVRAAEMAASGSPGLSPAQVWPRIS